MFGADYRRSSTWPFVTEPMRVRVSKTLDFVTRPEHIYREVIWQPRHEDEADETYEPAHVSQRKKLFEKSSGRSPWQTQSRDHRPISYHGYQKNSSTQFGIDYNDHVKSPKTDTPSPDRPQPPLGMPRKTHKLQQGNATGLLLRQYYDLPKPTPFYRGGMNPAAVQRSVSAPSSVQNRDELPQPFGSVKKFYPRADTSESDDDFDNTHEGNAERPLVVSTEMGSRKADPYGQDYNLSPAMFSPDSFSYQRMTLPRDSITERFSRWKSCRTPSGLLDRRDPWLVDPYFQASSQSQSIGQSLPHDVSDF